MRYKNSEFAGVISDRSLLVVNYGVNKHTIPNQRNAYSVLILNFEFCGKLRAGVPPVEQTFQDEF
ncbi:MULTISPECIES: hypothetical protein [Calothrix]|uniref:Uncharacterized protein n=2 Tax=Calothrix TaxID=1186 RepID=A0ABR8A3N0_9CYAN|nr:MULTISPECIES: hypothetical protein [Calothrix]MBD2194538.1 hypothetical protein [Calothrix parietina FACHB-288]MBD2223356.1 hypothetical protein [Calothrix anomala FACHB-343]